MELKSYGKLLAFWIRLYVEGNRGPMTLAIKSKMWRKKRKKITASKRNWFEIKTLASSTGYTALFFPSRKNDSKQNLLNETLHNNDERENDSRCRETKRKTSSTPVYHWFRDFRWEGENNNPKKKIIHFPSADTSVTMLSRPHAFQI